jgi:hypothetical protein
MSVKGYLNCQSLERVREIIVQTVVGADKQATESGNAKSEFANQLRRKAGLCFWAHVPPAWTKRNKRVLPRRATSTRKGDL